MCLLQDIGWEGFKCFHHEVLPTEDDPETEEGRVENALLHVGKQQHPRPLQNQREPFTRQVQCHRGDAQGQDCPVESTHAHKAQ